MKITQIRNATLLIEYANVKFLVDPIFADVGTYPPFPSFERSEHKNPLTPLPMPVSELINVDSVILTHLHIDHFDEEAKELLPKAIPIFVQNIQDLNELQRAGFLNITILNDNTFFKGVQLFKTEGIHGYDKEVADALGEVCGVVLKNTREKTLYIAGDTIWCSEVENAILKYKPEVIVLNVGANSVMDKQLIMGKEEALMVHNTDKNAAIVATHMEGVNHWTLTRASLREFAEQHNFSNKLYIPEDGEIPSLFKNSVKVNLL